MKDKLEFLKRPWAITRDAFEVLAGYDFDRCEASPVLADLEPEDFDEKLEIDEVSGIATLDVNGPLMQSPSLFARFFMGAVDLTRVEQLIRTAQNSSSVRALVVRMNTPGGTVSGTPETGNAAADFTASGKPLYVFSRGLVASAGYWIAAPATELIGTESSRWGSVGVIRPHVDMSEARAKAGVKVELFTSGKHKGAGAMNTSLTEEQRKAIQEEVVKLGDKFRAHVSKHRGGIKRADMEAQVFYADEALAKGYIDRVVTNFDEFIEEISEKHRPRTSRSGSRVDTASTSEDQGDLAESEMKANTNTETDEKLEDDAQVDGATDTQTDGEGATNGATDTEGEGEASTGTDATDSATQTDSASDIMLTDAQLAALEAKIEARLEAKIEAKLTAQFNDKVNEKAAEKAARIAAESATDAADVTGQGDSLAADETRFASLDENALWAEYEKIRESKGDNDARAFYTKHLEGR